MLNETAGEREARDCVKRGLYKYIQRTMRPFNIIFLVTTAAYGM